MEQWYALHTKPHKECMVRSLLENRGIETYLPLLRANGRRTVPGREQPFFARYLFARLDLTAVPLSSITWSQGMTSVVSFGGRPAVVPDEVIGWLQARLAQVHARDYHGGLPLLPDTPMRVVAGPLKGMGAIFDRRLSGQDRARVLVRLLGQLTSCDIRLSWLTHL